MIRTTTIVTLLAVMPASGPSLAGESNGDSADDIHPLLTNGFTVDIGLFFPTRTLGMSVNDSGPEQRSETDFDEAFSISNADETTALELTWQFGEKWSFRGQYFKSTYGERATLSSDIEWGDVVFESGSSVAIGGGFQPTRFFFGRQLHSRPRHYFGIGGELHWLDTGSAIEGDAVVNGTPLRERRAVRAEAPLPNIGTWYRYSISPVWAFRSRFDLFGASVGQYSGITINAALGLNYRATKHVGFGAS